MASGRSDDFPINGGPRWLDRRQVAGLILTGGSALVSSPQVLAAGLSAGRVNEVVGDARAELRAKERKLAPGEALFIGDTVVTGEVSRIGLNIGDASVVHLGSDARLKIDRFLAKAGSTLTLQSGPMLFERPKSEAPQPMQIRGAFGLIAVRGTHFFAGPNRGSSSVLVLRGLVSVTSGGETVILNQGEGTDILSFGGKPTKPSPWSGERVNEAFSSVR